jgi:hypothetical protein
MRASFAKQGALVCLSAPKQEGSQGLEGTPSELPRREAAGDAAADVDRSAGDKAVEHERPAADAAPRLRPKIERCRAGWPELGGVKGADSVTPASATRSVSSMSFTCLSWQQELVCLSACSSPVSPSALSACPP